MDIHVTITIEDDRTFLVSDERFYIYGTGANIEDAVSDYVNSLLEYHQIVERSSREHSPSKKLLALFSAER